MMAALVATVSRGAIGALVLGLFFHLMIAGRGRRVGLASGMVALVLIAIGVDVANGGAYSTQLSTLVVSRFDAAEVRELNGRTDHWAEFARLFASAPMLGTGYYGTITVAGGTGHSLALTTLAERGLLGTVCSVAVLMLAAWRALAGRLRASDPADRLLFACVLSGGAASLIHLMVEDANLTHQYIVFSWLALALPLVAWWERVERPATRPVRIPAAPDSAPAPVPG
jgi:O-antigen ligase